MNCQNNSVGFYDDEYFYLNMTSTIKALRKFCLEQGENLPPNANILLKHLDEDGFLLKGNLNNRTHSVRISSTKNVRVAMIKREKILSLTEPVAC